MEKQVFISYSSKEADAAFRICDFLESNGENCWIAPRDVEPGASYATQIVNAIRNCKILILLASLNTNISGHVSNEVSIAFDNKKVIIPYRLENFEFTDEYMYFLGRKHWIEAYREPDQGYSKLLETVKSVLNQSDSDQNHELSGGQDLKTEMPLPNTDLIHSESAVAADSFNKSDLKLYLQMNRSDIASVLIKLCEKFSYNIYNKIKNAEKKSVFLSNSEVLLQNTVQGYYHGKPLEQNNTIVDEVLNELENGDSKCVQVQGLPGSAKNLILQLVFFKLLEKFVNEESDLLPIYLSAPYYEKLSYDGGDIEVQMNEAILRDLAEYSGYLTAHSDVRPCLLLEGIREHVVAKVFPETKIYEAFRGYGRFARVTTVDVGLVKNRSRIKRVIPIVGDSKGLIYSTHQIPIDDKERAIKCIESVLQMYDYSLNSLDVYLLIRKLGFIAVDVFIIRLVSEEMISVYDSEHIRLIDIYEKLALSELDGDEEQLKRIASDLYEYTFSQSLMPGEGIYDGQKWKLPHKHSTYLEFMIAYYFIRKVEEYTDDDSIDFFDTMLTSMSNHFVVSYMEDNYVFQEKLLKFINDKFELFDVQQKSNAFYWLGRITYKNLTNEAILFLTKEFTKYKLLVKGNNKNTQENLDNHFMFRSICAGLLYHGQANYMDEFLCIVITNDIANSLNRGATIEYYGDSYQMAAHDVYYLDTDLSAGETAIRVLNSKLENALNSHSGEFVEANLVTLLTLIQARIQNVHTALKYDVRSYAQKALGFVKMYQTRPQNVVSGKLLGYFESVREDIELYLNTEKFDIGSVIYRQYNCLKFVKRKQWVSKGIEDPESVTEHTYSSWLLAAFFLPEEDNHDGYNKKEIMDMLLIHDMAEAVMGDRTIELTEPKNDIKEEDEILRKLFLKGTYPDIANLTYFYNIWTGYYNAVNINARTARDVNLLQSVYTFFEYYLLYPDKFTQSDLEKWKQEKGNLKTEVGHQLFERLIENNPTFSKLFVE